MARVATRLRVRDLKNVTAPGTRQPGQDRLRAGPSVLHLVGGSATLVFATRGGHGWTTGGRRVAAMEARRCRAIATRQAQATVRAPKAPPENRQAVARATGATRSGAKKTGARLPHARVHPRSGVHHPG